jgi:Ricin-type beta-trefoil lectin domain-like/Ricin-type beta-trefoil lectin domain
MQNTRKLAHAILWSVLSALALSSCGTQLTPPPGDPSARAAIPQDDKMLKRFRNPTNGDHLTAAVGPNPASLGMWALSNGYQFEGDQGLFFGTQLPDTIPLKVYFSPSRNDYMSLGNSAPLDNGTFPNTDYRYVGTTGFIFKDLSHAAEMAALGYGLTPLTNWESPANPRVNQMLSNSPAEGANVKAAGWRDWGVQGYSMFHMPPVTTTPSTPVTQQPTTKPIEPASGVTPFFTAQLRTPKANKCLDIPGGTLNPVQVQQWECNRNPAQDFDFELVNDTTDTYRISNTQSHLCLSVPNGANANGTPISQNTCSMSPDNLWKVRPVQGQSNQYQLVGLNSKKCMDVAGISQNAGAKVLLWDCHQGEYINLGNQTWEITQTLPGSFSAKLFVPFSNQCLDVPNGERRNGLQFQQWYCNGLPPQDFRFNPVSGTSDVFTIWNHNTGQCLDAAGLGKDNGTPVQEWECNGGANQKWQLKNVGIVGQYQLVDQNSGKCLNVVGISKNPNAKLELWECNTGENIAKFGNQTFVVYQPRAALPDAFMATLRAVHSSKCLDVPGGDPNETMAQYNCNGNDNQHFWVSKTPNGAYRLRNIRTDKCVSSRYATLATPLIQVGCTDNDESTWDINNTDSPSRYRVKARGRGSVSCMEVIAESKENTAAVNLNYCNSNQNQSWTFNMVPDGNSGSTWYTKLGDFFYKNVAQPVVQGVGMPFYNAVVRPVYRFGSQATNYMGESFSRDVENSFKKIPGFSDKYFAKLENFVVNDLYTKGIKPEIANKIVLGLSKLGDGAMTFFDGFAGHYQVWGEGLALGFKQYGLYVAHNAEAVASGLMTGVDIPIEALYDPIKLRNHLLLKAGLSWAGTQAYIVNELGTSIKVNQAINDAITYDGYVQELHQNGFIGLSHFNEGVLSYLQDDVLNRISSTMINGVPAMLSAAMINSVPYVGQAVMVMNALIAIAEHPNDVSGLFVHIAKSVLLNDKQLIANEVEKALKSAQNVVKDIVLQCSGKAELATTIVDITKQAQKIIKSYATSWNALAADIVLEYAHGYGDYSNTNFSKNSIQDGLYSSVVRVNTDGVITYKWLAAVGGSVDVYESNSPPTKANLLRSLSRGKQKRSLSDVDAKDYKQLIELANQGNDQAITDDLNLMTSSKRQRIKNQADADLTKNVLQDVTQKYPTLDLTQDIPVGRKVLLGDSQGMDSGLIHFLRHAKQNPLTKVRENHTCFPDELGLEDPYKSIAFIKQVDELEDQGKVIRGQTGQDGKVKIEFFVADTAIGKQANVPSDLKAVLVVKSQTGQPEAVTGGFPLPKNP